MGRESPEVPDAEILRLVSDGRIRMILAALAGGPLRPVELDRLAGISRETLYKRLHELSEMHMACSSRSCKFPFAVRYELTPAGRVAYAKALLMAREQRRLLAPESPSGGDDIRALLRLLSAVLRFDAPEQGACLLVEHDPGSEAVEACVLADDRTITLLERHSTVAFDATVHGTQSAWDSALTHSDSGDLEIAGDHAIARAVLAALQTALGL